MSEITDSEGLRAWFREQTQSWYVKIDGIQHPLGKGKREADRNFLAS